jgi:cytochrome c peroxidase
MRDTISSGIGSLLAVIASHSRRCITSRADALRFLRHPRSEGSGYRFWRRAEKSKEVSPFTSKFHAFLKGKATLTATEMAGYNLFRGKAGCNTCHVDGRGSTQLGGTDTSNAATVNPLFTCFGSANLGLPLNPRNAFYYQTTPDFFGFTPNPFGFAFRDLGLGTFLRSGFGSAPNPNAEWIPFAPMVDGQMQVSTARNVAMVPICPSGSPPGCVPCPTTEAPGPFFQKEFFHNGYIKSLKQLVHFYNTRGVYPFPVTSGHCPPGKTEKVDCWPMPEVKNNLDMTTGMLGLTDQEENQVVAFLQTLTDGFTNPLSAGQARHFRPHPRGRSLELVTDSRSWRPSKGPRPRRQSRRRLKVSFRSAPKASSPSVAVGVSV